MLYDFGEGDVIFLECELVSCRLAVVFDDMRMSVSKSWLMTRVIRVAWRAVSVTIRRAFLSRNKARNIQQEI